MKISIFFLILICLSSLYSNSVDIFINKIMKAFKIDNYITQNSSFYQTPNMCLGKMLRQYTLACWFCC